MIRALSLLASSLFFTDPAPLDMPRAEGYRVTEGERTYLEDRFVRLDLWLSQAVIGRWYDEDDREFILSRLGVAPPAVDRLGTQTRVDYAEERRKMPRVKQNDNIPTEFLDAVALLAPCDIVKKPRKPHQLPRGYKYVYYWQHPTNYADIVCSFLPERTNLWYLATWRLADGDDYAAHVALFEDEFLRREFPARTFDALTPTRAERKSEREQLRADARHAVAAYANWHYAGAKEFAVLDDLPAGPFVATLTNDFPKMRAKYAATLPTPIDVSEVLSVVRLYASRAEYEDALWTEGHTNMLWSAAYWCPSRREIVAYLPREGGEELLQTIRHEALHQYLSYACAMVEPSPWINEGYAQFFERERPDIEIDPADVDGLAPLIAPLLAMGYGEFYGGSDQERALKYKLALSVAVFLEEGAPKVRFQPFKYVKRDYLAALLETHDMRKATVAALKDADTLKLFVTEWRKFWKDR